MDRSPLLPTHQAAGARLVDGPPPGVLTYGDVPGEYAAGRSGCVLFDATVRGRVAVSGEDRTELLHRILANRVRGIAPGAGNRSLLLTPKGKVRFDFDLAVGEERIELSTQPGRAADLLAAVDTYLFAEDVQLADESGEAAPLELAGPRAADLLGRLLGPLPEAPHAWREGSLGDTPVRVTALPVAGSPGFRVDAGPAGVVELWEALVAGGATPAGLVAHDSLRVEACRALQGVDVDENVYPQEARLEEAFDLEKGCYIGQEVVAKIDTYGGLNKRLVTLRVEGDDPVPRGTSLVGEDGRELGLVTSWAYSFELDGGAALAYAKRRHRAVGTRFRLGPDGPSAEIVPSPIRGDCVPVTPDEEELAGA